MEENYKPSYEQLEQAVAALQNRCMTAEYKVAAFNLTTKRLDYLFKVLEYEDSFDTAFIQKCTEEIKELLEIQETEEEQK